MMFNTILEVQSLTRQYGSMLALDHVNLSVKTGEFVALLGPSGCGKTTLLRCLGGFTEPTSGEVLIGGASMKGVPPHRRPINTVFQNYALFPHLSIQQNIAFGPLRAGKNRKTVDKRVTEMLELVGLSSLGERYPAQLSGGQQQRVAIARAIINEPRVLLLDEPLGALDLKLRKHMQIELKRLQEKLGITFIFVTHDQEEALVMADRIAVMNKGKIEQLGTGDELYRKPASLFVADFIGDTNLIPVKQDSQGTLFLEGTNITLGTIPKETKETDYKLLVRPEELRLTSNDVGENHLNFTGRINRQIFIGDATRMYITLENGFEIMMKIYGQILDTKYAEGTVVNIYCRCDSARLFPV